MTKEEVLNKLKLTNATGEQQDKILADILAVVEQRFAGIVDDLLDDAQTAELNNLTESGSVDEVVAWVNANVPKAAELYMSILEDYVTELSEQLDQQS